MGYLGKDYKILPRYSDDVAGFKYFSSQGGDPPSGGFGYRCAFFTGRDGKEVCKQPPKPNKPRDCTREGILKKSVRAGRMWHPRSWKTTEALDMLASDLKAQKRASVTDGLQSEFDRSVAEDPGNPFGPFKPAWTGLDGSEVESTLGEEEVPVSRWDRDGREEYFSSPAWQDLIESALDEELTDALPEEDISKFDGIVEE